MAHHEPFKSLCPAEWASISKESLPSLLQDTFAHAQTVVDSLPLPPSVAKAAAGGSNSHHGRPRSRTEPSGSASVALNQALSSGTAGGSAQTAKLLHKEWREVKMNPRDNPLAINVYKLGAKDGKGTWFARRSVHEGISFDKFRAGLEKEFLEALRVRKANPNAGPGAGNVRGIGAEKRVELDVVDGVGKAEVYQLSAQFPGPTTPRDFVTLLLTTAAGDQKGSAPRQFMMVSKPCVHPECPPRQGFIRGQYESVEIIREIPIEVPLRKVRSSIDLNRDEVGDLSKAEIQASAGRDALLKTAQKVAGGGSSSDEDVDDKMSTHSDVGTIKDVKASIDTGMETETAVEWLMVTRSDPGGSVPRFMVEKGTPAGIVSDAGKLLNWLASKSMEELGSLQEPEEEEQQTDRQSSAEEAGVEQSSATAEPKETASQTILDPGNDGYDKPTGNLVPIPEAQTCEVPQTQPATGIYGMITGAIGVAGSVISSRLSNPLGGSARATDSEGELDDKEQSDADSDTSSFKSFSSAVQSPPPQQDNGGPEEGSGSGAATTEDSDTLRKAPSSLSKESQDSDACKSLSRSATHLDKELRKLHERRRRVHEKIARVQERSQTKRAEDRERDEREMARLREKHEKELARQEQKYQRELRKIEERRLHEEKKAEQRRRKQVEREEKANMALELDRVRAERDLALKRVDILTDQIGELQAQNTVLVATLGKHGLLKGGGDIAWKDLKRSNTPAVPGA